LVNFGETQTPTLLCVLVDGDRTAAAALNGNIYVIEKNQVVQTIENAHPVSCCRYINQCAFQSGVYAMKKRQDTRSTGYVTAGRDGHIRVWDTQWKPTTTIDFTSAFPGRFVWHITLIL
jgi:microtubule-associated protein-like 6